MAAARRLWALALVSLLLCTCVRAQESDDDDEDEQTSAEDSATTDFRLPPRSNFSRMSQTDKQRLLDEQRRQQTIDFTRKQQKQQEIRQVQLKTAAYNKAIELLSAVDGPIDWQQALALLDEAAACNNSKALTALGQLHEFGTEAFEMDPQRAFDYYRRAADLGNSTAQRQVAYFYDIGRVVPVDKQRALVGYTFAEQDGDVEAMMILGFKHLRGLDVPKSCPLALQYYERAAAKAMEDKAEEIHLDAHHRIELLEEVVEYDEFEEEQLEEQMTNLIAMEADQGNIGAQVQLAVAYMNGNHGVQVDYEQARQLFEQAAVHEHPDALANLGIMHEHGFGMAKNYTKALEYYERAAELGNNAASLNNLGHLYLQGIGIKSDPKKAAEFFKRAARLGNGHANTNLAILYENGYGVERNPELAFHHARYAADKLEQMEAMYVLGRFYRFGVGTRESCARATEYFKAVAERGSWRDSSSEALALYQEGNVKQAFLIYEKLAHMGFSEAQVNAAYLLQHHGQELVTLEPPSRQAGRALLFYHKAAEQKDSIAQLRLGDAYYYGQAVERNLQTALQYYRLSASNRNSQAAFNLGLMHQYGTGVERNFDLARQYYEACLQIDEQALFAVQLALAWLAVHRQWVAYETTGSLPQLDFEAVILVGLAVALAAASLARRVFLQRTPPPLMHQQPVDEHLHVQ